MATPKVSVIAVLCGAEERLEQCLDSILGQNFKSLELICVDCGADDESLRLLQERASDDARVRVICQGDENEGAARNRGLQKAVGEYLFFATPAMCATLVFCRKRSQRRILLMRISSSSISIGCTLMNLLGKGLAFGASGSPERQILSAI